MNTQRGHTFASYASRDIRLGDLQIARALPIRERKMVGPWCFFDRFGPVSFGETCPLDVAPHPHIGLQTVTWLLAGEVRHNDSLGYEAVVTPGGVNVMTAGVGIAHAERTPVENSGQLSGVQLWAALPDADRAIAPAFESISEVPHLERPGGLLQIFSGTLENTTSPATHYSKILGADLTVHSNDKLEVELRPEFEHALMLLEGDSTFEGHPLQEQRLYDLGTQRTSASFSSAGGARLLLIGGPPFPEPILMWWNFVARTREEIIEARTAWEEHRHFGEVSAYPGPRLEPPEPDHLSPPDPIS
jgi:quercetin 2,3-dioxygenase